MTHNAGPLVPLTERASGPPSKGLSQTVIGVAAAPALVLLLGDATVIPTTVRATACLLWALCVLPSWGYLTEPHDRRPPIPFVPFSGILYGLYYALPVALGVTGLNYSTWLQPDVHYRPAIEVALAGWTLILASYALSRRLLPVRGVRLREVAPEALAPRAAGLLVAGLVWDYLGHAVAIPLVLAGLMHFLGMIGTMGLLLFVMLWMRGLLPRRYVTLTVAGGAVLLFGDLSTGSAAPVAWSVVMLGAAAWAARGRVSGRAIVLVAVGLCSTLAVKGVLVDFRSMVWYGSGEFSPRERVAVMRSLVADRVEELGPVGTVVTGFEAASARSGVSELLADVIRRTPSEIPYWGGETYGSLVGTFVPRFLWPSKPVKNLGQEFGHRYLYLSPQDQNTAYNLPWLVEFYANFGRMGVLVGPLFIGLIYGLADRLFNRPSQPLVVTAVGILLLIPMGHVESDFSLTFGGLFLQGTAAVGIAWLVAGGSSLRPATAPRLAPSRSPSVAAHPSS